MHNRQRLGNDMVNGGGCRCFRLWAILLSVSGSIGLGWAAPAAAQTDGTPLGSAFERCQAVGGTARLHCMEAASAGPSRQTPIAAGWRLVRTPNPETGHDVVSVTRTADTSQSDLDLAGLMLRCGENGTEVLFVVIQPFPPRAHPEVTVKAGSTSVKFTASIVTPGALVLLPPEGNALAQGAWQSVEKLDVLIADKQNSIRGVIPVTGLGAALALLQSNCQVP